jgi:hypothetical protein
MYGENSVVKFCICIQNDSQPKAHKNQETYKNYEHKLIWPTVNENKRIVIS